MSGAVPSAPFTQKQDISFDAAFEHTRAVFATLAEALPPRELRDILDELPRVTATRCTRTARMDESPPGIHHWTSHDEQLGLVSRARMPEKVGSGIDSVSAVSGPLKRSRRNVAIAFLAGSVGNSRRRRGTVQQSELGHDAVTTHSRARATDADGRDVPTCSWARGCATTTSGSSRCARADCAAVPAARTLQAQSRVVNPRSVEIISSRRVACRATHRPAPPLCPGCGGR